jgi:hypothetical protein
MMILFLLSYISFTVYLLFNKNENKLLKSLGTIMAIVFGCFMLFVTMSSIIGSFIGEIKVSYTILLFSLLVSFLIIYFYIKVLKVLE